MLPTEDSSSPTPATPPAARAASRSSGPDDIIRVRVISNQPVGEPGGPYTKGTVFETTLRRAAAIGEQYLEPAGDAPLGPPPEPKK